MNIEFNFIEVTYDTDPASTYSFIDEFSITTRKINKTKSDETAKKLGRVHHIRSVSIPIETIFDLILRSEHDHGLKSVIVAYAKKAEESDVL